MGSNWNGYRYIECCGTGELIFMVLFSPESLAIWLISFCFNHTLSIQFSTHVFSLCQDLLGLVKTANENNFSLFY